MTDFLPAIRAELDAYQADDDRRHLERITSLLHLEGQAHFRRYAPTIPAEQRQARFAAARQRATRRIERS